VSGIEITTSAKMCYILHKLMTFDMLPEVYYQEEGNMSLYLNVLRSFTYTSYIYESTVIRILN
jgi:hypothetical protein